MKLKKTPKPKLCFCFPSQDQQQCLKNVIGISKQDSKEFSLNFNRLSPRNDTFVEGEQKPKYPLNFAMRNNPTA